ncbi:MAG: flagellar basal body rod protein FlgC [Salinisphaeraceae bacterium]
MAGFGIFDIAGSAMAAQSVRLNTVASNMANADAVTGDPATTYRALHPVFHASRPDASGNAGVSIAGVVESTAEPQRRYQPGHPAADADGYVYAPNVDVVEQMVDMISASRSYQNSVEVLSTTKDLMLRTLELGK